MDELTRLNDFLNSLAPVFRVPAIDNATLIIEQNRDFFNKFVENSTPKWLIDFSKRVQDAYDAGEEFVEISDRDFDMLQSSAERLPENSRGDFEEFIHESVPDGKAKTIKTIKLISSVLVSVILWAVPSPIANPQISREISLTENISEVFQNVNDKIQDISGGVHEILDAGKSFVDDVHEIKNVLIEHFNGDVQITDTGPEVSDQDE